MSDSPCAEALEAWSPHHYRTVLQEHWYLCEATRGYETAAIIGSFALANTFDQFHDARSETETDAYSTQITQALPVIGTLCFPLT
jgi:hypothetical protein